MKSEPGGVEDKGVHFHYTDTTAEQEEHVWGGCGKRARGKQKSMAKIMIIDDDALIVNTLRCLFESLGHQVESSLTLSEGLDMVQSDRFDLVFLDVRLPDGNGLDHLETIQAAPGQPEVIILTGYADSDGAELAMKSNAWDYLKKPATAEELTLAISQALSYHREKQAAQTALTLDRYGIVGDSPAIRSCLDLVARSAVADVNVLITGETGTGKELFARAVHANSRRKDKNFVVLDCGAIPESLMESILFGHAKGAFTGAVRAEEGLILHAHGGTLFLDEVGELPLLMQKVFLRVLQERNFRPIGDSREIQSDFRLIAASNRNLDQLVKEGRFREDLLFRLKSVNIHLPPLKDRVEDIKPLVVKHLMLLCESLKINQKGFSPEFLTTLETYPWPGNVRELFSAVEWAVAQALSEPVLYRTHLPSDIRVYVARSRFENSTPADDTLAKGAKPSIITSWKSYKRQLMGEGEKRYMGDLMAKAKGDVKSAAKISGLSVPRIYELLRKHRIPTR